MNDPIDCIIFDEKNNVLSVVDYTLNGFDHLDLNCGNMISEKIMDDIELIFAPSSFQPDLIANPLSWLVCSQRLTNFLRGCCNDDIQVLKCKMSDINGIPINNYFIVNVISVVNAIDLDKSDVDINSDGSISMIFEYVFEKKRLKSKIMMFRDENYIFSVFLRRSVTSKMPRFSGLLFEPCIVV